MKRLISLITVGVVPMILLLWTAEGQAQYVGAAKCRPCHLPQSKSWQAKPMAKAFEQLKPGASAEAKKSHNLDPNKDYTTDAKCVGCHVTGYGAPGGFVSMAQTPKLAGVQCEACHGAGEPYLKPNLMSFTNKEYKRSDLVAAGMVVPSAKTCGGCHNEKSPFYKPMDFKAKLLEGSHDHFPMKFKHE